MHSAIYQGKRLKNNQNVNFNIWDVLVHSEVSLKKYFQESLYGKPICMVATSDNYYLGTHSHLLKFDHRGNLESNKKMGPITYLAAYEEYVYAVHGKNISFFKDDNVVTITHPRHIKQVVPVPINATSAFLQFLKADEYVELLALDDQSTITRYSFEHDHQYNVIRKEEASLFKFGSVCEKIKLKHNKPAKVQDPQYVVLNEITCVSIMNESFQEDIQDQDDLSEKSSVQSQPELSKKQSFINKLFKRPSVQSSYVSNQFVLVAVLFRDQVMVVKYWFGKGLTPTQTGIQVLMRFSRPDASIYNVVFNDPKDEDYEGVCTWGVGAFKETNRRYALLIVNWSGKEFHAFKCMKSENKLQVVQGGHLYLQGGIGKGCYFLSNSIFITATRKEILFLTTLQFEYGVPFGFEQIDKTHQQEKQIELLQSEYKAQYESFDIGEGQILNVPIKIMESVHDGYQKGIPIDIGFDSSISVFDDKIFALFGSSTLWFARLKTWSEYLEDLSFSGEWSKTLNDALDMLEGRLTLFAQLPENDADRFDTTREFFCKLTLTLLVMSIKEDMADDEVDRQLSMVMNFLFRTQNQDYLFGEIYDMFVGAGKMDRFYWRLTEVVETMIDKEIKFHIPGKYLLRILQDLSQRDRIDIVKLIVFNLQEPDFDPKPIVNFLIDHDLIAAMVQVCSLVNDFLSPFLRIMTTLQVQPVQLTSLSTEQMSKFSLEYLKFCLTGQYFSRLKHKHLDLLTERQFKTMLKEIFEYLFDIQNLRLFLEIDYRGALEVFLLVFSERIQSSIQSLYAEGGAIKIRVPKDVMDGLYDELFTGTVEAHFEPLRRIYILIRQTELSFLSEHHDREKLFDISVAFTTHVVSLIRLNFSFSHVALAIIRYVSILREGSIFDIKWVLKGRITKDVDPEITKNEFLWQVTHNLVLLLENKSKKDVQYLHDLYQKSINHQWLWLQAWTLIGLGRMDEAFKQLLASPNHELSDKIFHILIEELKKKNTLVQEWILQNIRDLVRENSQKTFILALTFYRRQLKEVAEIMVDIGELDVDEKLLKKRVNLGKHFFEFLSVRLPRNLWDQSLLQVQMSIQ